jgi:predicted aconitase with swiveling domain
MERVIQGHPLVAGEATGRLLVTTEPLSFWGGYDPETGAIIDHRHPLLGEIAAGRILALPFSRGSSTTTAILLEAIHNGCAPAAIITTGSDAFFALASIVAGEMSGKTLPVLALDSETLSALPQNAPAKLDIGGALVISDALTGR